MIFDDNCKIILFNSIKNYVVGAREAIIMNTHNIGFYEEIITIIF